MGGTRVALNIEGSYLNGQLLYFSVSDHGRSDSLFVGIALSAAHFVQVCVQMGGLSSAPPIPAGIRSFRWNSGGIQWNGI